MNLSWKVPGAAALGLALLAGCERSPAPSGSSDPAPAGPPAQTQETRAAPEKASGPLVTAGAVSFEVPAGWREVPPSNPMRAAELHVESDPPDAARRCVVAISLAGGSVDANIARWASQVTGSDGEPATPVRSSREVAGLPVHTVELVGTYMEGAAMGGGTPRADWMMRGAIIEAPSGQVFVKMTGPVEPMRAAGAGWTALIDGLRVR